MHSSPIRNLLSIRATLAAALLVAALFFAACSSSEVPVDNDNDDAPDTGVPEDTGDDEDASDDADADVDPCPVCCPGDKQCSADGEAVETCNEAGDGFEVTETCESGDICDDAECVPEPVCEPGEQICDGSSSILTCRATGTGYTASDCPDGESCYDDECVSGGPTGLLCDDASDCAGGFCRCGEDESCTLDQTSYCTSQCTPGSCSGNELCWQSEETDAAGYDHCLLPCGAGACQLSECKDVMVEEEGDIVWRSACLPQVLKGIGDECDNDDECLSGTCDQDSYSSITHCTRRCEVGGCPDGTACVDLDGTGAWCYPECEGSQCTFSISCSTRSTHDGGVADICIPNQ